MSTAFRIHNYLLQMDVKYQTNGFLGNLIMTIVQNLKENQNYSFFRHAGKISR